MRAALGEKYYVEQCQNLWRYVIDVVATLLYNHYSMPTIKDIAVLLST